MPDRTKLQPGDRIRLLHIPDFDVQQRRRELRAGTENAGWTADTLQRILDADPVVQISHVDEFGTPWFEYELTAVDGVIEYHSIAILDDDSWEPVDAGVTNE